MKSKMLFAVLFTFFLGIANISMAQNTPGATLNSGKSAYQRGYKQHHHRHYHHRMRHAYYSRTRYRHHMMHEKRMAYRHGNHFRGHGNYKTGRKIIRA